MKFDSITMAALRVTKSIAILYVILHTPFEIYSDSNNGFLPIDLAHNKLSHRYFVYPR